MSYLLIQATFIAKVGNEESTFWMQIFVFSLLAASWWVFSLVKNKQSKFKDHRQNFTGETKAHYAKPHWRFQLSRKYIKDTMQKYATKAQGMQLNVQNLSQEPTLDFDSPKAVRQEKPGNELVAEKNKDLRSGMELLKLEFLLSVVEDTESNSHNDIAMRKLNFNELLRRKKLDQVSSKALKVYVINQGNIYDKKIQCEAMKELAERTVHKSKQNLLQPDIPLSL